LIEVTGQLLAILFTGPIINFCTKRS